MSSAPISNALVVVTTTDADQFVSGKDAAALIGVKEQTMRLWRHAGRGPRFTKLGNGGSVRYRLSELRQWMAQHEGFESTAAAWAAGVRRPQRREPISVS